MICKVCGAQNEEGSNYCKICAAPLKENAPVVTDDSPRYVDPPADVTAGDMRSSWGFVRAPKWPRPNFDADSISDEDMASAPVKRQPVSSEPARRSAVAEYEEQESVSAPRRSVSAAPRSRRNGYASDEDYGYDDYQDASQSDSVYSMDEEDDEPILPRSRVRAGRGQRREADDFYDDDYDDDMDENGFDYDDAPAFRRNRREGRGMSKKVKSVLFWVAAAALVILIALFAIILIYKDKGGLPAFFGGIAGSAATREPVMEPTTMDDGSPAYAVTIYAKDGSIVRFTYPDGETTDITVKNGMAAARVPESVWYPSEPVESSPVSVQPNFAIVDADGAVTPVELPEIQLEVPAVTLTLSQPASAELESDTSALAFAGTVSDPEAAVFVNDQQFAVNADGSFSGSYELGGAGVYSVVFEGRKGGCVIGRQEVSVTVTEAVPEQSAASSIALAEDGVLRSTGSTLTVKGTMEAGSTITATGDVSGQPTVDSAAGTFSFTASTPDTGKQYTVTITATKDGKTTTKDFHIERAPDYKEYVESAWRMDYDRIVSIPTESQAYACKGTIVEVLESSRETVLAKMDVGGGDLVVIEYHPAYATAGSIEVGDKTYTIYAYPNGKHEGTGLPLMYAWFVNG